MSLSSLKFAARMAAKLEEQTTIVNETTTRVDENVPAVGAPVEPNPQENEELPSSEPQEVREAPAVNPSEEMVPVEPEAPANAPTVEIVATPDEAPVEEEPATDEPIVIDEEAPAESVEEDEAEVEVELPEGVTPEDVEEAQTEIAEVVSEVEEEGVTPTTMRHIHRYWGDTLKVFGIQGLPAVESVKPNSVNLRAAAKTVNALNALSKQLNVFKKKSFNVEAGNEDLKTKFQNFIDMTIGNKNYSKIARRYAELIKVDDATFKGIKVSLIRKDKMVELNRAYMKIIDTAIEVIDEYRQYHGNDFFKSRGVALDEKFQKEFSKKVGYIVEDFASKMSNKQDYLPKSDTLGNLGYRSVADLVSVLDMSVSKNLAKIKDNTTYFAFIKGWLISLISAIIFPLGVPVVNNLLGLFFASNTKTSAAELFETSVIKFEANLESIIDTLENIYNQHK